jgi:alkaline phosphatase D
MPITRRSLLGLLSSSTFLLTVAPGTGAAVELPAAAPPLDFPQGVASGDPQPDGIMLWTRAVPATGANAPVTLLLQLSPDSSFSAVALQAQVHTNADCDYTVRAYIAGLAPDTQYYYRFLGANASVSRTGRTRTAPSPGQARKVNLAFASCQNFEQAHYGSWARMLKEDRAAAEEDRIQFVLHLGDFIYEQCWYQRPDGSAQARTVPPFPDGVDMSRSRYAISLADYRLLYKTYLSDPHLQEARARWPFICTWDDHEFADDCFQSFSTYDGHTVLQAQRKLCANQAWFEFVPALLDESEEQPAHNFRPQVLGQDEGSQNQSALDSLRIYRKLSWGKYLDLVLTDNRSYRSPPCLPEGFAAALRLPLNPVELVAIADGGSAYKQGNPPATLPYGDGTLANPAKDRAPGSMLGLPQREWFLDTLKASTAPWKLWANSLPLMPLRLDLSSLPLTGYEDSSYTIDGWEGYPHEVSVVMRQLEDEGITGVVSLSGDHHMHGAGTIRRTTTEADALPIAVDFTVAGISSSPVFEDLVAAAKADHRDFATLVYRQTDHGLEPVWNIAMLYGVLAAYTYSKTGLHTLTNWLGPNHANPGLRYVDTTANGYGLASFDADDLRVQLITMQDCRPHFVQPPEIRHVARFRLPRWRAGERPQLEGPEFEGSTPFPFKTPTV